jgi:LuxR family quorum-sensing system transcriptional regulator CciR
MPWGSTAGGTPRREGLDCFAGGVAAQPREGMFDRVEAFVKDIRELTDEEDLAQAIGDVTGELGLRYFALAHHVDVRRSSNAIRLHNYPPGWGEWFEDQQLGASDPVRRASNLTSIGFSWSDLDRMLTLTQADRRVLDAARREGIGDGFTVPAHVPGEAHGSCSFACASGNALPGDVLPLLQLIGGFAFEAARRLRRQRLFPAPAPLTERQRECVMWAARGKSDWEISRILGISHATVVEHLRHARERYGVAKRTLVAVHALFDGTIGFLDVLRH